MSLLIESRVAPGKQEHRIASQLLEYLSRLGYEALLSMAKQKFTEVFGGTSLKMTPAEEPTTERLFEYAYRRTVTRRYRDDARVTIAGDLFYSSDGKSILYISLGVFDSSTLHRRPQEIGLETQLEIGFIGEEENKDTLVKLEEDISKFMSEKGIAVEWSRVRPLCVPFAELRQSQDNKFILANSMDERELEVSERLEEISSRNLAVVIRRSGGILASDLAKKSGIKAEQTHMITESFREVGLIAQEYVVICKKTSNQINRVDRKEKIEQMTEIGVLCSCGSHIGQERIEELFSPTPLMQKMLDQSYWMTARLVRLLKELKIHEENILLNLQEGSEEIDAFVDVDGTLLMFELKDNEFSMGHAYPFGGRIGLYKPEIAVIVATKGIAPEVREYFKRVRPGAEIVYIGSLREFDDNLQRVITQIRSRRAYELISQFEPMASIDIPVAQMITNRLGIVRPALRRRGEE